MPRGSEGGRAGNCCIFLARIIGALAALLILACGFVTVIPIPTQFFGSIGQCIATGLLMIIMAVIMFFLEASMFGHCVEKLAFLLTINKYMRHWMRAAIYSLSAIGMFLVLCISTSTIIGLGTLFTVGVFNFVLAIGQKGDHSSEPYQRMRQSGPVNAEAPSGEESGQESDHVIKESTI